MNNHRDCEQVSLLIGVNEPVDPANLSNLEKKHIPSIKAPQSVKKRECFDVTLEVGKAMAHPNESIHFIQFVDLYADGTFLARTDFTAVRTCPRISLCIALEHPVQYLQAYACCNLHGTWVGRTAINVEEQAPVVSQVAGVQ